MTKPNKKGAESATESRVGLIQRVFSLLLMLMAVSCCSYLFSMKFIIEKEAREALNETEVADARTLILGNYEVRFDYADSTVRFTGTITQDISENYILTILSEYSPRILPLSVDENGVVSCDELGRASISRIPDIDKLRIKFEKENFTCTLTK